ncbi:MAG: histidinol dehydrogenase, partial [Bacteroidetes bacterium]
VELMEAIGEALANLRRFHAAQIQPRMEVETMPGVRCWRKSVPIERVGLYVPGGSAPLFSTVLMLGVPAMLAGCPEVVLCTPPDPTAKVNPAILFTAGLLGIERVFRIGGAQAIAALAYGTESIPRVDKIFGPGNAYVTRAKQLVQLEGTAIDMPAGPSEVLVLADDSAEPAFVAADLLSQAEHGPDSQVVLVSLDASLPERVQQEIERRLEALPRASIARQALENSLTVHFDEVEQALAFSNAYAPEHLLLQTRDPQTLAEKVRQAGSVFLGPFSPESVGDYASGTNHTLPTNGFARAYSGLSVDDFVRKITFQQLSAEGLQNIASVVEVMAEAENLQGHAEAVRVRRAFLEREGQAALQTDDDAPTR